MGNCGVMAALLRMIGMAHHLETVLEAAQLTAGDPRIVYLLVGDLVVVQQAGSAYEH